MSCQLSPSTGSSTAERPAFGRWFTLYASHHCRRQADPTQCSSNSLNQDPDQGCRDRLTHLHTCSHRALTHLTATKRGRSHPAAHWHGKRAHRRAQAPHWSTGLAAPRAPCPRLAAQADTGALA